MERSSEVRGLRSTAFVAAFALAGLSFVLYPAIRPFSSEVGMDGARAFSSPSWVVAHSLGIAAFVLVALGALGVPLRLRETASAERTTVAMSMMWIGVGLTLPYYGAEAFGLHAVGQHVLAQNDPAALQPLAHAIRWEAGIWFIVVGLLLLAVGSVLLAATVWRSGVFARWSAIPFAVGLFLYLPQFGAGQPLRVTHGVLMLAGCMWLARELAGPRTVRASLVPALN